MPMRKFAKPPSRGLIVSLGEILDFVRLVWAIDHGLQVTSKRMEARLGITALQRFVIRIVGRFPTIPVGRLAQLLHLDPSALTPILQRLHRLGLLERRKDPRDGRRILLGLTAKGRELDSPTDGTIEALVEQTLRGIPANKVAATQEVLERLAKALGTRG